ncbi:MAG: hypothetical protein IPI70_08740 [Nitrospira sp.]|nr:hypothetical protein [Nitrospira sp.]
MAFWCKVILFVGLALLHPAPTIVFSSPAPAPTQPQSVPAEEYPFYDLAVEAKFLTSRTRLVVIERMTATRLHPEECRSCRQSPGFQRRHFSMAGCPRTSFVTLSPRLIGLLDWIADLTSVCATGLCRAKGLPDAEAAIPVIPVAWPVEEGGDGDVGEVLDRLAFSRVGLTVQGDQALLYVANQRPDATGAGFLFWFVRRQGRWEIYDTDVLWVAQPDQNPSGRR